MAITILAALSLSTLPGCMNMAHDLGWTVPADQGKSSKPTGRNYGDASVTVNSNKSSKSTKAKSRNIFQRDPDSQQSAGRSAGQPDFLADTESNIIRVNKIVNSAPWLSFDPDGTRKVDGFRITVYLESGERPKGVFGDGVITVQMFRLERDKAGRETAQLAQEWVLPPEKAYQWRATEPSMLGMGYSLRLNWDESAKVNGKQVAILVKYQRTDGRMIVSTRQVLKVPAAPSAIVEN